MADGGGGKVILILIDGLSHDVALERLGYMEGLVSAGAAQRWAMRSALPSLSRPLYETVCTGVVPHHHGVTTNATVRRSTQDSVFSVARAHGKRTAAAAHAWFSELYNRAPYDPVRDKHVDDEDLLIQHGRFYRHDGYPDEELFHEAAMIVDRVAPNFLLIHPMNCDEVGHRFGGTSSEYKKQAHRTDDLLATFIPDWKAAGYDVLVTSDHGMDEYGHHGGDLDIHRLVAFYVVSQRRGNGTDEPLDQLAVAPTVLSLMGLRRPSAMTAAPVV